jgi:hypothetical protein
LIYRERQLTQLTDLGKEVLPMLERTLVSAETAVDAEIIGVIDADYVVDPFWRRCFAGQPKQPLYQD